MQVLDKTPNCVKQVLDEPGIYLFTNNKYSWFFEITKDKKIYQLNPQTMKRDGILSATGWNEIAHFGTVTAVEVSK